MHNPASLLENDTYKLFRHFDIQTDHLISARRRALNIVNNNNINKRENLQNYGLCCPFDHRIKLKECVKKDKYLEGIEKLWNMKVTIIPILTGAFGTVTKGLLKGLDDLEVGGQVETIQTTALFRTVMILRRVLKTCCHSNSSERPSANADMKNYDE